MKTRFKSTSIALALLAFSILNLQLSIAHGQGTAFTYQGKLDAGGAGASGYYDFQFALYNDPQIGNQVGFSVTNSAVTVSNGLFLTTLDFGAGIFTGNNLWLQILVRTNGGGGFSSLVPRQQVTPAPYATLANTAANLRTSAQLNVAGLTIQTNAAGGPNLIGGSSVNFVGNGAQGATISGGGIATGSFASTNSVIGDLGTVGGGGGNTAYIWATVSGGEGNTARGINGAVGGGAGNTASGISAVVSGGTGNMASGFSGTVGGGDSDTASGNFSVVSGGTGNTASGYFSMVPGGENNIAAGNYSFAGGHGAQALNNNSFVWGDGAGTGDGISASTADYEFDVFAYGGINLAGDVSIARGTNAYHHLSLNGGNSTGYLYGSYPALGDGIHLGYNYYYDNSGAGHVINTGGATSRISAKYGEIVLAVGGVNAAPNTVRLDATTSGVTVYGTFNNSSDRNVKQKFVPVNPAELLAKVVQLPISEWSYKTDATTRHIGPMGQDFYATFNIGTDEKHIAPIDEGGVALAAIQGLNQKLNEKDAEIQTLEKQLNELRVAVKSLTEKK